MAKLCLTLTARTLDENRTILEEGAPDLAELRIDLLAEKDPRAIAAFAASSRVPLILTCRKECDGGEWTGPSPRREALLRDCLEGPFAFIDLEEDEEPSAAEETARRKGCRIIRSFHDFQGVPADLEERLGRMSGRGDLVKAAVMPRGVADLARLFRIGRRWEGENLILLGMGDYGVPTRILAGQMNSFLTFCSPPGQRVAAPGHMDLETLRRLYRADRVDRTTPLYGIIGSPVLHTRSPQIHNNGLIRSGREGVYLPFTVDDPAAFFSLAEELGLRGFSVTVPHKQAVIPLLDRAHPAVEAVGACNTVLREAGEWRGYNSDVPGFLAPLKARWGSPRGWNVALLGAGGAARSALYALREEGARVRVFNRTPARAEALAGEMGCSWGSMEEFREGKESWDLIVQTTSAGMEGPSARQNPLEGYPCCGKERFYDIVYAPPVTPAMDLARREGCSVLGGWPMLVEQAREQFRLFTGGELPEDEAL